MFEDAKSIVLKTVRTASTVCKFTQTIIDNLHTDLINLFDK